MKKQPILAAPSSCPPPPRTTDSDIFPLSKVAEAAVRCSRLAYFAGSFSAENDVDQTSVIDWKSNQMAEDFEPFISPDLDPAIHDTKLGRGTYGAVIRVRHRKTGRIFAVKSINKRSVVESLMDRQVESEIRFQISANHPNILRCHGCVEDDQNIHLFLDCCDEGDLYLRMKTRATRRFFPPEAFAYFMEIVNGLAYMHSRGYFHRDMKLENLLIGQNGELKIADFGWIGRIIAEGQNFNFCGTLDYLCPEMVVGCGHDWRTDTWGLGILLFEMLAGQAPFHSLDPQTLILNILNKNIQYPADFSSKLRDVIDGLLDPVPETRLKLADLPKFEWVQDQWRLYVSRQLNLSLEEDNLFTSSVLEELLADAEPQTTAAYSLLENFLPAAEDHHLGHQSSSTSRRELKQRSNGASPIYSSVITPSEGAVRIRKGMGYSQQLTMPCGVFEQHQYISCPMQSKIEHALDPQCHSDEPQDLNGKRNGAGWVSSSSYLSDPSISLCELDMFKRRNQQPEDECETRRRRLARFRKKNKIASNNYSSVAPHSIDSCYIQRNFRHDMEAENSVKELASRHTSEPGSETRKLIVNPPYWPSERSYNQSQYDGPRVYPRSGRSLERYEPGNLDSSASLKSSSSQNSKITAETGVKLDDVIALSLVDEAELWGSGWNEMLHEICEGEQPKSIPLTQLNDNPESMPVKDYVNTFLWQNNYPSKFEPVLAVPAVEAQYPSRTDAAGDVDQRNSMLASCNQERVGEINEMTIVREDSSASDKLMDDNVVPTLAVEADIISSRTTDQLQIDDNKHLEQQDATAKLTELSSHVQAMESEQHQQATFAPEGRRAIISHIPKEQPFAEETLLFSTQSATLDGVSSDGGKLQYDEEQQKSIKEGENVMHVKLECEEKSSLLSDRRAYQSPKIAGDQIFDKTAGGEGTKAAQLPELPAAEDRLSPPLYSSSVTMANPSTIEPLYLTLQPCSALNLKPESVQSSEESFSPEPCHKYYDMEAINNVKLHPSAASFMKEIAESANWVLKNGSRPSRASNVDEKEAKESGSSATLSFSRASTCCHNSSREDLGQQIAAGPLLTSNWTRSSSNSFAGDNINAAIATGLAPNISPDKIHHDSWTLLPSLELPEKPFARGGSGPFLPTTPYSIPLSAGLRIEAERFSNSEEIVSSYISNLSGSERNYLSDLKRPAMAVQQSLAQIPQKISPWISSCNPSVTYMGDNNHRNKQADIFVQYHRVQPTGAITVPSGTAGKMGMVPCPVMPSAEGSRFPERLQPGQNYEQAERQRQFQNDTLGRHLYRQRLQQYRAIVSPGVMGRQQMVRGALPDLLPEESTGPLGQRGRPLGQVGAGMISPQSYGIQFRSDPKNMMERSLLRCGPQVDTMRQQTQQIVGGDLRRHKIDGC